MRNKIQTCLFCSQDYALEESTTAKAEHRSMYCSAECENEDHELLAAAQLENANIIESSVIRALNAPSLINFGRAAIMREAPVSEKAKSDDEISEVRAERVGEDQSLNKEENGDKDGTK